MGSPSLMGLPQPGRYLSEERDFMHSLGQGTSCLSAFASQTGSDCLGYWPRADAKWMEKHTQCQASEQTFNEQETLFHLDHVGCMHMYTMCIYEHIDKQIERERERQGVHFPGHRERQCQGVGAFRSQRALMQVSQRLQPWVNSYAPRACGL